MREWLRYAKYKYKEYIESRELGYKPRIAIYTAIFGDKDDLLPQPESIAKQADLICFTDNPNLKSDQYKIKLIRKTNFADPTRNAKIFKILPHLFLPEYSLSAWIDSNVELRETHSKNIINLLNDSLNPKFDPPKHMALFVHPDRDCVYDEAEKCKEYGLDFPELIDKQIAKYRAEGYPEHNGLWSCPVILRRTLALSLVRFEHAWWREIKNYSRRDQISFPYIAHKTGFVNKLATIDAYIRDNEYWRIVAHKKPFNEPLKD